MTKHTLKVIAFFLIVMLYLGFGFHFLYSNSPHTVKYNCELSEISPDFPPQVKEECRKLRSGRI